MYDFLNSILQWLYVHPNAAGAATFIISSIESVAIIGTIIPGSLMMTAIGTLAGAGIIPLWSTIIWAILGAIVGDGISYWLGYYFKHDLHQIWPFRKYPYILLTGERFFYRHGGKSVFIGRFVGPVRALVPLVAGMLNMNPWRFTFANITSAIGWAPAYMLPGLILGAASLELPPDATVHFILMLLLIGLLSITALWLIQKFFNLVSVQINQTCQQVWHYLSESPRYKLITRIIKHHDKTKIYTQLILIFYFLLTLATFIYLSMYISLTASETIKINNTFFHFFRSLRSPLWDNILVTLSFLGDKYVLLPVFGLLFMWFLCTKRFITAWHTFFLCFISVGSIQILKLFIHTNRPWGIVNGPETFSFPSGHTTLVVTFYMSLALLLTHITKPKHPIFIYLAALFTIISVSLSRLYLGMHWFTDIIGGYLLGAMIILFFTFSYNRFKEKSISLIHLISTTIIFISLSFSLSYYQRFAVLKQNVTKQNWPVYSLTLSEWWDVNNTHFPLTRLNRFGFNSEIFNLEWLDELKNIKSILLKNGWKIPSKNTWITVFHRITDIKSAEHLPLVSPLHLDRKPVLVLIKKNNKQNKYLVLRLWQPDVILQRINYPLWVGVVEEIPRTYSWLFNRKKIGFRITPTILFKKMPNQYIVKTKMVASIQKEQVHHFAMVLIKPKQLN